MEIDVVYNEDCLEGLKKLPDNSVDCCVTSPPYYALRDYGTGHWEGGSVECKHESATRKSRFDYSMEKSKKRSTSRGTDVTLHEKVCPDCGAVYVDNQIGLEETPQAYIDRLTEVFMEVYRVLKPEGTLWVNIGDSYVTKPKSNYDGKGKGLNDKSYGTGDTTLGYKEQADRYKIMLDTYKNKDLIGIPWMLAFNLRSKGWYLRQDIIWHKPNPMPESVTDRCVKSHEYVFLFSKSRKYYFDYEQIQEKATTNENRPHGIVRNRLFDYNSKQNNYPEAYLHRRTQNQGYAKAGGHRDCSGGFSPNSVVRNKRDVWSVPTKPDTVAHFATYPEELIRPCILAGCPMGGVVLDPFMGSGTTARCARRWNRHFIGFELNPDYIKIINKKINVETDMFAE